MASVLNRSVYRKSVRFVAGFVFKGGLRMKSSTACHVKHISVIKSLRPCLKKDDGNSSRKNNYILVHPRILLKGKIQFLICVVLRIITLLF
jgi:hypothetical protein